MNSLLPAIQRLAQLQRQSLDKHELVASLEHAQAANLTPVKLLMHLKKKFAWQSLQWLHHPKLDPSLLPCLAVDPSGEWRVLKSLNSQGQWVFDGADGETTHHHIGQFAIAKINFRVPFDRSSSPV